MVPVQVFFKKLLHLNHACTSQFVGALAAKMCPNSKHFNKMQSQEHRNGLEQHNKDLWTREIVKMRPEHFS